MAKVAAYDKEFREGVVQYTLEHPEESYVSIGEKFGIHGTTVSMWKKQYEQNDCKVEVRGTGNFSSDLEKENYRLRKELKDTQDALEVLKKAIGILGK